MTKHFIDYTFRISSIVLIGGMAGIALPNLLSCACEAPSRREGKSALGALNRAQMAYYNDHNQFANRVEDLEVPVKHLKYYTIELLNDDFQGVVIAKGRNNEKNNTWNYIGGINYNLETKNFTSIVCMPTDFSNQNTISKSTQAIVNYGLVREDLTLQCGENLKQIP